MIQVLGPVNVITPGTPVRVTAGVTIDAHGITNQPAKFSCHAALFQARKANTGKVYIGLQTMNITTGVGVAAVLAIPTDNAIPAFSVSLTLAPAGIDLSSLYLDADVAGEGALLTILVT